MTLDTLLRKSKSFVAIPLLGMALACSPLYFKNSYACLDKKNAEVIEIDTQKTLEDYTVDYDMGIYFLGIKLFSARADFYYKKTEENGVIKEFMGADGKYSEKYYGSLFTVSSKDGEPFESHAYTMNYTEEAFVDKADFYKDKIVFTKEGLEHIITNEGCVGLQSMIKPLYTEDLREGQEFHYKTFLEGKHYNCTFFVKQEEQIKIKGKHVKAHYVTLKAVGDDFYKETAAEIWVVKGKPYNKLVKVILTPFLFTKATIISDP